MKREFCVVALYWVRETEATFHRQVSMEELWGESRKQRTNTVSTIVCQLLLLSEKVGKEQFY